MPSEYGSLLITPQYETERVLRQRADALGVRGAEVTGLTQDAAGVTVAVRPAQGAAATYRASYVVGADGVNSAVRRASVCPTQGVR